MCDMTYLQCNVDLQIVTDNAEGIEVIKSVNLFVVTFLSSKTIQQRLGF